ncbi:hypothetical protein, partial [Falsirhodobacter xinxiangensis]|uniref:hypothetical protein n=1 Tax=Falsirhodobacter xinxiangensis TaxID=2530049 RepID=UPI001C7028EB
HIPLAAIRCAAEAQGTFSLINLFMGCRGPGHTCPSRDGYAVEHGQVPSGDDIAEGPAGQNAAIRDQQRGVADLHGVVRLVLRQDHPEAAICQPPHLRQLPRAVAEVEAGRRLVEDEP